MKNTFIFFVFQEIFALDITRKTWHNKHIKILVGKPEHNIKNKG